MIIIINPGSLNLQMGRASDVNPHRILNAIARRRKPHGNVYRDTVLPGSVIKVCILFNSHKHPFRNVNKRV